MKAPYVVLMLLGLIMLTACSDHVLVPGINNPTAPTQTHKRIALLCMLANVNYDRVAASEAELSQNTLRINEALQTNAEVRAFLGTDWQVVWGPSIANSKRKSSTSAVDSFVTDNTMYVARGTDLATGKPLHVVPLRAPTPSREKAPYGKISMCSMKSSGARKGSGESPTVVKSARAAPWASLSSAR